MANCIEEKKEINFRQQFVGKTKTNAIKSQYQTRENLFEECRNKSKESGSILSLLRLRPARGGRMPERPTSQTKLK